MSWRIVPDHADCPADTPIAVVNEDTDEVEGCHATTEDAQAQIDALEADEGGDEASTSGPGRFEAVLTIEGEETTDMRYIEPGALTWRELPIPLTLEHGGPVVGRIEEVWRVDNEVWGRGTYDSGDEAQEARRKVEEQTLRWVSIDPEYLDDPEYVEQGDCSAEDELDDLLWLFAAAPPINTDRCRIVEHIGQARIMGAAIVAYPAFPAAVIVPEGTPIPEATENGRAAAAAVMANASTCSPGGSCCSSCASHAGPNNLTASAFLLEPSAEWFDYDPDAFAALQSRLEAEGGAPSKVIEASGRTYGYVATWHVDHIGYRGQNMRPPHSSTGYAYFHTGGPLRAKTPNGETVELAVGQLTMGAGHPETIKGMNAFEAKAHYDGGPGVVQVVDCRVGEDDFGIWYCGAMRPGLTDGQVRNFEACSLSGDWRGIGRDLELIAVAAGIPVPGFPILHRGLVAAGHADVPAMSFRTRAVVHDGRTVALVAAGVLSQPKARDRRLLAIEAEVRALRAALVPLIPLAVERMRTRVNPGG